MGFGARAAALRESLEARVGPQEAARIMHKLYPLFDRAELGAFELGDAADEYIRAAIGLAIGRPVTRIVRVSCQALARMPSGQRRACLSREGANLRLSVWIAVLYRRSDERVAAIGYERKVELERELWEAFLGGLRAAFDAKFIPLLGRDLALQCWNSLAEPIAYHLAFRIAGHVDAADELEPLLALLPSMLPLCELERERGTWLVLVE